MSITGIPVWRSESGNFADSFVLQALSQPVRLHGYLATAARENFKLPAVRYLNENVEDQIRKVDEKIKKDQGNSIRAYLSCKMSFLSKNCKCGKEKRYSA